MTTNLRSEAASEEPSLFKYEISDCSLVEIRPNNNLRLSSYGTVVERPVDHWIRAATEGLAESVHIDKLLAAISWYYPPVDVVKIRRRYMETINETEPKK